MNPTLLYSRVFPYSHCDIQVRSFDGAFDRLASLLQYNFISFKGFYFRSISHRNPLTITGDNVFADLIVFPRLRAKFKKAFFISLSFKYHFRENTNFLDWS